MSPQIVLASAQVNLWNLLDIVTVVCIGIADVTCVDQENEVQSNNWPQCFEFCACFDTVGLPT